MPNIPELLNGHVTLEMECLDNRLYLNGYIGPLATSGGLVTFMRGAVEQADSPVVLGQVSERFRVAVKALAERQQIPIYQFAHKGTEGRCCQHDPAARRCA